jgi:hypothetical protein
MIMTVTGGREFHDGAYVEYVLDGMHRAEMVTTLRHGGALGVDSLAGEWARRRGVPTQVFWARWEQEGRRAGPNRNARMLDARPSTAGLIAFPGGRGTDNCVLQARKRRIPVFDVGLLYQEWRNKPLTFVELAVRASRELMHHMEADEAVSGVLRLNLSQGGPIRPEIDAEEAPDVVE